MAASRTLGKRLRELRTRHGLSQRELAKRAQVTNSTISQVEQDAVSPSVSSLNKILEVFPISLSDFFSDEIPVEPPRILRGNEHEPIAGCGPGLTLRRIDQSRQTSPQPQVELGSLAPGCSAYLQAAHDSLVLVTLGALRIEFPATAACQAALLECGDAARLHAGERYQLHWRKPEASQAASHELDIPEVANREVTHHETSDAAEAPDCQWLCIAQSR
ncbi:MULTISPECIES: helix-turn-helix domain-containing protein [unclassified Cobetia]|uniref:helix-turn-helix domain-containing protein n=1 Tax=Cobetia sp. 2AS1 TaxID=2778210 RepID=UPI00178CD3D7|nr:helix-turn-helix domain-containing protein [Cobetia sp. 2AS]MBE2167294.1 helix-turn-helix domain-containing protein [Cobetia sp. 2AS1]MDH2447261.1 helix-turn-helix domain-containing protein [Cobetia sp. 2AS]